MSTEIFNDFEIKTIKAGRVQAIELTLLECRGRFYLATASIQD